MLKRNISLADRVKAGNEQIYYIMDALNEAINTGKKVRFLYFEFTAGKRKKLKNDGEPYILSPYTLTWNGDNYYVVGWSDKHEKIATFRVDRFYQVPEILPDDAIPKPKKFSIGEFAEKAFQLFDSEHANVELLCENSMMSTVLDHFGSKVKPKQIDKVSFINCARMVFSSQFSDADVVEEAASRLWRFVNDYAWLPFSPFLFQQRIGYWNSFRVARTHTSNGHNL